ncbi:M91 family zinc metallopeptidase [uncultured Winogradskyella sp.]|uniref:M91 family zinc metallopeptidase n=1 Tax=uncultured Winogradskyella sp. TaxID=395353 RepID=UPI002612E8C9|nr:M91 family zinc metallopeptidase [uncultured Winogradskyella sp.]
MPTIAIDPDGKRIVIIGSDEYSEKVRAQLAVLATTEEGSKMILEMANSKDDIVIGNFGKKGNQYVKSIEKEDGTSNHYVNFLPGLKRNMADGTKRDPAVSLGHELGHVSDEMNGKPDNYYWEATTDDAFDNFGTTIEVNEIDNVHRENLVRAGLGVDLRNTYDGVQVRDMQLGQQKWFGGQANSQSASYLFELVPKPENMHFDYSSVPKASKKYFTQTANGVKPYSIKRNISEWAVKRHGFTRFSTNFNKSDKATILEGKSKN